MASPIIKHYKISGTDLVRRFQGGTEISPIYIGTGTLVKAQREAKKSGYKLVEFNNSLYVYINKEWQDWTLTDEGVLSIIDDMFENYGK